MAVQIESLTDHPEFVETIARWHLRWEWPLRACIELAEACARPGLLPSLYVARLGIEPVGEVTLIDHDMELHRDLTPWLSALFVQPEHRGQGIGAALVAHLESQARSAGIRRVYLYTSTAEGFYTRLGWTTFGRERYENEHVVLMSKLCAG
jgi:GNAT superfamily N-acetyltransferase